MSKKELQEGHTHPVCPICSGELKRNRKAPGRLICRACNLSFDEKRIIRMWKDGKYKKLGRKELKPNESLTQAEAILNQLKSLIAENIAKKQADEDRIEHAAHRKNGSEPV